MGGGRQRHASPGPLPTIGEKDACLEALMEQQDWDDVSPNLWPGPDAAELNTNHQISPTQPVRIKAAPTSLKAPPTVRPPHTTLAEQRRKISLPPN